MKNSKTLYINTKNTGKKHSNDIPAFRERLEFLRKQEKLTQAELAKKIGCSVSTYQSWVNPKYKGYKNDHEYVTPSADKIMKICDIFNVSMDYLFGRSDYTAVDNAFIGEYTGLSDYSIKAIRKLDSTEKYILNAMFDTYPQMPFILRSLKENIALVGHHADIQISIDGDSTNHFKEISEKVTSRIGMYKSKEMFKYDTNTQFNRLIDSLFEDEHLIGLSRKAFFEYINKKYELQTERINNFDPDTPEPQKPIL